MPEKAIKWTIITGNPVDGLQLYGLFDDQAGAVEWASNDPHLPEEWWVFPIYSQE